MPHNEWMTDVWNHLTENRDSYGTSLGNCCLGCLTFFLIGSPLAAMIHQSWLIQVKRTLVHNETSKGTPAADLSNVNLGIGLHSLAAFLYVASGILALVMIVGQCRVDPALRYKTILPWFYFTLVHTPGETAIQIVFFVVDTSGGRGSVARGEWSMCLHIVLRTLIWLYVWHYKGEMKAVLTQGPTNYGAPGAYADPQYAAQRAAGSNPFRSNRTPNQQQSQAAVSQQQPHPVEVSPPTPAP